jgi:23S rRNA G2445 N2-methylase RlmL
MTERSVKKHVHGKPQVVRVDSGPGWRAVVEDELRAVLSSPLQRYKFEPQIDPVDDGIEVRNLDFRQMLELPLRILTASEISWQIDTRHVGSFGEFEAFLRSIEWGRFLPEGAAIKIRSHSFRSALYHEGKLDLLTRKILEEFGFGDKDFRYLLRVEQKENRSTVYLSLTPEPLFRRRYKKDYSHPAPLQEHLAASAIRWSMGGIEPDFIYVPFAGSGTLVMESWFACHRPALDLWRDFHGLEQLPDFPSSTWAYIKSKLDKVDEALISSRAIEIDRQGYEIFKNNLTYAETRWPAIKQRWEIELGDFAKYRCPQDKHSIFLPLNPPYGLRIGQGTQDLYRQLGRWIARDFEPNQRRFGFVLVADSRAYHAFEQELGRSSIKGVLNFSQGGQHIRCVRFEIEPRP